MNSAAELSHIKASAVARAAELGFALCGVAPAGPAPHAAQFERWLEQGRHASMEYLARNARLRADVRAMEPWTRSVLCLAASYAPGGPRNSESPGLVARYAAGRDYHRVLRSMAHRLADELCARVPGLQTRVCVDTAPLAERDYAWAAGLGWIGRNGCLIHPKLGSYLLLTEILLSVELPPDEPMADHCGRCRRCVEACPTGALVGERELDARRCISWATIEHCGELDGESIPLGGMLFGCDGCQQACPFNRQAPEGLPALREGGELVNADVLEILNWSAAEWDRFTHGSARRRATFAMYLRNACLLAGQAGLRKALQAIQRLAEHEDPAVRSAARWAILRLG